MDELDGPLQRTVRAIDRASGRALAETTSDPTTGAFELIVYSPNPCIVYAVGDGAEKVKIFDKAVPVPA